jgi:hypothetical protein
MGESKRRRQATRNEKRGAILRRRFGEAPLELHLFSLCSVEPPVWGDPLSIWRFQVALAVFERQKSGKLFCIGCDGAIAVELPPVVGFAWPEDRDSELAVLAVCETCLRATDGQEDLADMVSEALGRVVAPDPPCNKWVAGLSSAILRRIASRSPSTTQAEMSAALRNFTAGRGASCASSDANSRVNVLIRAVRCSCVIHPPFARHAPGDRREHRAGDASSADFDANLARRIVSFDDEALFPARDGLAAQGAAARDRNRER